MSVPPASPRAHPSQGGVENNAPFDLEKSSGRVKKVISYTGILAIISAISSCLYLSTGKEEDTKKGEQIARVYVVLEVALILSVVAFVALKVAPYALRQIYR